MVGGLKCPEIGKMMGVDYCTVSQGRKRFRERLKKDRAMVVKWKRNCQYEKFDLSDWLLVPMMKLSQN